MSTLDAPNNMQNDVSPRSTGIRYGFIAALITIALAMTFHVTGMTDYSSQNSAMNWISSLLSYAVIIGALVLAMKKYREDLGGYLTFGQGFTTGFWAILIIAIVSAVWSFLFFSFIAPDVIDTMIETARDQMAEQQGMSEEQIEQAMQFTSWMMSPVALTFLAAIGTLIMGVIFDLIIAAIMQRKPPVENMI